MDDEQVLLSLRPYRFVQYAAVSAVITVIGIVLLPFVLGWAVLAERRYHYWLTNKRVIWCHGFIGYRVRSVPLERITDVVISRTLPEMMAGISSIEIRDMTGQSQEAAGSFGAKWIGVEDAPEVQRRVLQQIREVNEAGRRI
ncbi:MAG: PH domain-containing protein [Planctomycetes bacterium]|nr:PH domain-containing protein [Planctomycetota bacterium]